MYSTRRLSVCLLAAMLLLTSCTHSAEAPPSALPTLTPLAVPMFANPTSSFPTQSSSPTIWISPAVPSSLRELLESAEIPPADSEESASLRFLPAAEEYAGETEWIYALVAPFPTILDGVTEEELRRAWTKGIRPAPFEDSPLLMSESTRAAMTALWGEPADGAVRTLPSETMLDAAWESFPSWGILPFEDIEPRWKVLTIDGNSPLRKDFSLEAYPLSLSFALLGDLPEGEISLPSTNRDPEKLTVLVMTGVTALVRATAYRMEEYGVNYPAQDIVDWLRDADITHISNEIPFDPYCPPPNPNQLSLQFCSDPKYIELLDYVGTDIVELTGNHFEDRGPDATRYTLQMYRDRGLPYYGGGENLEDAQKPAFLENHGNRFAFLGCNPVGPDFAWAQEEDWPGAAPCDYEKMTETLRDLRAEGYLPIVTFQYFEYYTAPPRPWQVRDFRQMADAGAVIVSGSQAHFAQSMEFYNGAFIHYGLGNLFFDQMDVPVEGTRREFIDRHVFYDGRYLGTELLTAMLQDYARPEPMTPEEREDFLRFIFQASGWGTTLFEPTPMP